MPAYKRQHYLPVAYLKYFSIDQTKCARDSWVWRYDGQGQQKVRVDTQCASNYFYSKDDAASTEKMFQRTESDYCYCIDKLRRVGELGELEIVRLLLCMYDFFIRNAVHKNETGKEGIDAYRKRTEILLSKLLLKRDGPFTAQEILDHICEYWALWIVMAPPGKVFITSDNPSVWTSISDTNPGLHLITLPITPNLTSVAYNGRIFAPVSQQASSEDYLTLNNAQMYYSVSSMYASIPSDEDQLAIFKKHFLEKDNLNCATNETSCRFALAGLPFEYNFSFMQRRPPLM